MEDQYVALLRKAQEAVITFAELEQLEKLVAKRKQEKMEESFAENMQKVRDYIITLGLNTEETAKVLLRSGGKAKKSKGNIHIQKSSPVIFRFEDAADNISWIKTGLKGKAKWAADLKEKFTKSEARKYAIGKDGEVFIERIYS